ncbi:glycosyltransferase [Candidatus Parcubacteria bacterium]|nr:glycosyltransferase [Candidatus Parcubacteria bacterium]
MKSHVDHLLGYIPNLFSGKILDLGSGRGNFLVEVARRGGLAFGVEPYDEYVKKSLELARSKNVSIEVKKGVAESIPFPDSQFNFVNICEVIEHVEDPKKLLGEVNRVLGPGGLAYLSIPNRYGWYDPHFHLYGLNWIPRLWAFKVIGWLKKHKDYSGKAGRQSIVDMHYSTFSKTCQLVENKGFVVQDMRVIKIRKRLKHLAPIFVLVYLPLRKFYFNSFHLLLEKADNKVILLTHTLKKQSGWGRYSAEVAEHLKQRQFEVKVLEINSSLDPLRFIRSLFLVRKQVRKFQLVHALDGWPYGAYGFFGVLGTAKKLFVSGIGTYAVPQGNFFKKFLMQKVYRRAAAVFAISRYTKDQITKKVPGAKTKVVHMGLTRLPEVTKEECGEFLKKFGLDAHTTHILTVGEIKNRKGQYDTLQAFKILHDEYPQAVYIMVGKSEDKKYREKIDMFIKDHNLGNAVKIITHISNDRELAYLYSSAHVFALNSRNESGHFEGFGLVILEAAQFGVPAVGSRNCGIEDAIVDGVTGYLVNQGDIKSIHEAFLRALQLPKDKIQGFAESFSWNRTVSAYIDEYNSVI